MFGSSHVCTFDSCLHIRQQYMKSTRCIVAAAYWGTYTYKVRRMRNAWNGVVRYTPQELLKLGINAFKANWKEEQLLRSLLLATCTSWRLLTQRNLAVRRMQKRMKEVSVQDDMPLWSDIQHVAALAQPCNRMHENVPC